MDREVDIFLVQNEDYLEDCDELMVEPLENDSLEDLMMNQEYMEEENFDQDWGCGARSKWPVLDEWPLIDDLLNMNDEAKTPEMEFRWKVRSTTS